MNITSAITSSDFITDSTIEMSFDASAKTEITEGGVEYTYVYLSFSATSLCEVDFTFDDSYTAYCTCNVARLTYGGAQNKYALRFKLNKQNQTTRTSDFTCTAHTCSGQVSKTTTFEIQQLACDNTYTITWVNDNGTILEVDRVAEGSLPVYTGATPTKQPTTTIAYTFTGWTPALVTASSDATYTAQYSESTRKYAVSFNLDGRGGTAPQTQYIEYNQLVREPATPSSYCESFMGWYNGNTYWNFYSNKVTSDMTLRARWATSKVYVTFVIIDDQDNTFLEWTEEIDCGSSAEMPDDDFSGFLVEGWYEDRGFSDQYDFSRVLGEGDDITLYALLKEFIPFEKWLVIKNDEQASATASLKLHNIWHELHVEFSENGRVWEEIPNGYEYTEYYQLEPGRFLYIRGKLEDSATPQGGGHLLTNFSFDNTGTTISLHGNINYLWDYENLDRELYDYCGYGLFTANQQLYSAENLIIPTANAAHCYDNAFFETGLVYAPQLPATELGEGCYASMFKNTYLLDSPILMAENPVLGCYNYMFDNCYTITSITCNLFGVSDSSYTENWLGYYLEGAETSPEGREGAFYRNPGASCEEWEALNEIHALSAGQTASDTSGAGDTGGASEEQMRKYFHGKPSNWECRDIGEL